MAEGGADTQAISDCSLQDLDISLKSKMKSEQEPIKELLVPDTVKNEGGPLSERTLSNFDNQSNVDISNSQTSNCKNDLTKNSHKDEASSGKESSSKASYPLSDQAS